MAQNEIILRHKNIVISVACMDFRMGGRLRTMVQSLIFLILALGGLAMAEVSDSSSAQGQTDLSSFEPPKSETNWSNDNFTNDHAKIRDFVNQLLNDKPSAESKTTPDEASPPASD